MKIKQKVLDRLAKGLSHEGYDKKRDEEIVRDIYLLALTDKYDEWLTEAKMKDVIGDVIINSGIEYLGEGVYYYIKDATDCSVDLAQILGSIYEEVLAAVNIDISIDINNVE